MAKKVKTKQLGKGLGALLSGINPNLDQQKKEEVVKELSNTIAEIPVESIEVNPYQPRVEFDPDALAELSASLRIHGLIQPITVRRMTEGQYQLISGERRLRASKMAGLETVPAYIRLANDQEMLEMALVENIQREQLNAIEVAHTYQRLIEECSLTHESLAKRVGKSRTLVTNFLRLLKLAPDIKKALQSKEITKGHAMALAQVDDIAVQLSILQHIKNLRLSVRATEAMVKRSQEDTPEKEAKTKEKLPTDYQMVQNKLRKDLGAKVELKLKKAGKGQIILPFSSTDDLNRLLDLLEQQ